MNALFVVLVFMAFFGVLDMVRAIVCALRKAPKIARYTTVEPSNVKPLPSRVTIR